MLWSQFTLGDGIDDFVGDGDFCFVLFEAKILFEIVVIGDELVAPLFVDKKHHQNSYEQHRKRDERVDEQLLFERDFTLGQVLLVLQLQKLFLLFELQLFELVSLLDFLQFQCLPGFDAR